MSPSSDLEALRSKWRAAGQDHVFTFYDTLSEADQAKLVRQLATIDPDRVNAIHRAAVDAERSAKDASSDDISPPPRECVGTVVDRSSDVATWREAGLDAIRHGKVGVLLMAGGQGTRLGSAAPKGCYDIELPSRKSLFQLQAERIRRLEVVAQARTPVPWYIMTSGPTRKPTEDFFREHAFFGLREDQVVFFEQGVLPCLTDDGKVFLDTPSSVAVAPDGNGGLYAALRAPLTGSTGSSRTVLSDLAQRGVLYLHAYCVDNCLVRVADPVFVGYCLERKADCGAKVVKKSAAHEAVGVVAQREGRFAVVEYSEISRAMAERRDDAGELAFRAANIANHFYTREFLDEVARYDESKMPFHIARKKIPHVDLSTGDAVKPTKPNGMKLEQFVFDVFPFVPRFALLEAERRQEFSPLKNAPGTGTDDPSTSRRDLLAEQRLWLEQAGVEIAPGVEVELSPLVSYAGEGLDGVKGLEVTRSGVVESIEDLRKLA